MPDTPVSTIITARKGCVAGGVKGSELESLETRVNDAVDQGILAKKSSGTDGGYAATEEGGYRIHGQKEVVKTGGGNATVVTIDSSIDWRERRIMIRWQGWNAVGDLPGGATEDQNAPDYAFEGHMMFTSAGSTQAGANPPDTPRRQLTGIDLYLFVDSADSNKLKLVNTNVGTDYWVEYWIEATGKLF